MQQTSSPSPLSYQYSWWELSALFVAMALGSALSAITGNSNIGPLALFVVIIYTVIRDWYGVVTLRDWIHWPSLSSTTRTWIIIALFFFFPYAYIVYLVRAIIQTVQFYRQRQVRAPLERKLRVASMEAQLGMLPTTEGTCQACHKPLQAGAEFCHSCGAPVKEHPQICPKCAATTFPDARWCPMCGTPLK